MAQVKVFSLGGLGAPCCCGGCNCFTSCSPCNIPQKDLSLDWTVNTGVAGCDASGGTITLHYDASGGSFRGYFWFSDLFSVKGYIAALTCYIGGLSLDLWFDNPALIYPVCSLRWSAFLPCGGGFLSGAGGYIGELEVTSSTCTSFDVTFSSVYDSGLNCYSCSPQGVGIPCLASIRVYDSSPVSPPSPTMCACVLVEGCGTPLAGASVEINKIVGGIPVFQASCTTLADGYCCLSWQGTPGSYQLIISATGFSSSIQTLDITCADTITVDLGSPTSGECCDGCAIPDTLHITDSSQTTTLPWNGTAWVGCYELTVAAGAHYVHSGALFTCVADTRVSILYTVTCAGSGSLTITRTWYYCNVLSVATYCWHVWDASCNPTASGTHIACPFSCTDSATLAWSACSPFALSGNLSLGTCSGLSSPLTAAISMSS